MHGTRVDIFIEFMPLAGPSLSESITEGLHLWDEIGMGDLERSAGSYFGELGGIEFRIIMVRGALF